MSGSNKTSGPQFGADRPEEQEAVRTTIVGGRPPGSGKPLGPIPRGIDVLVKKAAVDPAFRALLLSDRDRAADEIGLALDPAEKAMLAAVPSAQLVTIIDRTTVPAEHRRAFLGKVAAAMLATMGIATVGCSRMEAPAGADPPPEAAARRTGTGREAGVRRRTDRPGAGLVRHPPRTGPGHRRHPPRSCPAAGRNYRTAGHGHPAGPAATDHGHPAGPAAGRSVSESETTALGEKP